LIAQARLRHLLHGLPDRRHDFTCSLRAAKRAGGTGEGTQSKHNDSWHIARPFVLVVQLRRDNRISLNTTFAASSPAKLTANTPNDPEATPITPASSRLPLKNARFSLVRVDT